MMIILCTTLNVVVGKDGFWLILVLVSMGMVAMVYVNIRIININGFFRRRFLILNYFPRI